MKRILAIIFVLLSLHSIAQVDSFVTTRGKSIKGGQGMFNGQFNTQVATAVNAKNDVLFIIELGQSNTGTDPNLGPLPIDSMPAYLKGKFSNVLIDTLINSNLYFTPLTTAGISAGYINQILWRESQVYKYVIVIKRSVGGTSIYPPATYPIADIKNYITLLKPLVHDIVDTTKCDIMYLYDQVETDGVTLTPAVNYKTSFLNLMQFDIKPNYGNYWALVKRVSNMQTDFPFRAQLAAGQDSVKLLYPDGYTYFNTDSLPMKGEGVRTSNLFNGDFSHHRQETAVKVGNVASDSIEVHFGKVKPDRTNPRIVRAYIPASGLQLILKFTKTMQDRCIPHTYNVTCDTKVFVSITIADDSAILVPSIPFYSGVTYTVSIAKNAHFKINFQDRYGNELSSVTSFPITNSCTISSPTFTTLYTSNFTTLGSNPADLPNYWTSVGTSTVLTPNTTSVTGVTVCAKLDMVAGTTMRMYKWTTTGMNTAGKIYQISFDIEVPRTLIKLGAPNAWYMKVDNLDHSGYFDFTGLSRMDKMAHIEYQFTEGTPTNDDIYLEFGANNGGSIYVKNFVIKSN